MGNAFKLQSVLNYRQIVEREAQQQVARALAIQGELMAQLARQKAEIDYLSRDLARREEEGIGIADLDLYRSHLRFSEYRLRNLEKEFEASSKEVKRCRDELMRCCQERQMVEKLKLRQAAAVRQAEQQRENLALDEIALRGRQGGIA